MDRRSHFSWRSSGLIAFVLRRMRAVISSSARRLLAVGVGGFSVTDNRLHVLLRLDPDVASGWSDQEVVRRWGRLFPPRDKSR